MNDTPLSTDPYKGVRDFYPEDKRRQNHLFATMKKTVRQFGYQQIDSSVLEPAQLYNAKSGSELAQEQSYRFVDRGDREVMLRPEMTPSTVRMLAAKHKSMSFPVRWFSLPNLFRYEQPQRGRLREHWQLNADIFGVDSRWAETEVIQLAHATLMAFGANQSDFQIRINSRRLFTALTQDTLEIPQETRESLLNLIDRRAKIDEREFEQKLSSLVSADTKAKVLDYLQADSLDRFHDHPEETVQNSAEQLSTVLNQLADLGINNATFRPSLVRGLDYYTGTVFEIFDTDPDNDRSICGGGRYDTLMGMFGTETKPAVGFGLGDVTLADFLDTHNLWPQLGGDLDIGVILVDRSEHADYGYKVANKLRQQDKSVSVNISDANVGTQIKHADNNGAELIAIIGDEEIKANSVTIKVLSTGKEVSVGLHELDSVWNNT